MDRVHERLAAFAQTDPDELRTTDSELPAVGVMLPGSTPHDSVGVLIDDRNAERAIAGVIENSYYEGRIRVIDIWTAIEMWPQKCAGCHHRIESCSMVRRESSISVTRYLTGSQ